MSNQRRRPLKVGLYLMPYEGTMDGRTPRWIDIVAMAQKAEEMGFDSVWAADHLLMRMEEGPIGIWECTSIVAAPAASTSRVELGTLVICTGFRNPALLAKTADAIDEISGGRLIFGLGAGYHDPEYHAFGYPTDHRYSRFHEAIQIIHGLLRDGSIDFSGTYHQARECELRPRGPRQGGPPIMIGARGKRMLRLTARYADIWNTSLSGGRPEGLEPAMGLLDAACEKSGRDPSTVERTAHIQWNASDRVEVIPPWVRSYGDAITGSPDEVAELFRELARAGISHLQVVVWPHTLAGLEAFSPVLEALDQTR